MKNIVDVLKEKEAQLQRLQIEIDALQFSMKLMSEDGEDYGRPLAATGSESRVKEIKPNAVASKQFP